MSAISGLIKENISTLLGSKTSDDCMCTCTLYEPREEEGVIV